MKTQEELTYIVNNVAEMLYQRIKKQLTIKVNKLIKNLWEKDLDIDHIVPISLGGKSVIDNLQVLCKTCNRKKYTN